MKRRWALSLTGDSFDLDDAHLLFRDGDLIQVAKVDDRNGRTWTALFADTFEGASSAAEVNELGPVIVDRINGILFVRDQSRQPVAIDAVLEWQADGPSGPAGFARHVFLAITDGAVARAKATFSMATGDVPPPTPPRPPEHGWLAESFDDPALDDVLSYLRGVPDWFDLWKAFEIMRADINHRSGKGRNRSGVAWPNQSEIGRFTGSVNYHRHSRVHPSWRMEPAERMSLSEAQHFLAGLVAPWQAWRSSAETC